MPKMSRNFPSSFQKEVRKTRDVVHLNRTAAFRKSRTHWVCTACIGVLNAASHVRVCCHEQVLRTIRLLEFPYNAIHLVEQPPADLFLS